MLGSFVYITTATTLLEILENLKKFIKKKVYLSVYETFQSAAHSNTKNITFVGRVMNTESPNRRTDAHSQHTTVQRQIFLWFS